MRRVANQVGQDQSGNKYFEKTIDGSEACQFPEPPRCLFALTRFR